MIAVLSIGDCELMMLRRQQPGKKLEAVFHTAMEVIEEGSAVHCVSVYQGDVVILGSDGVFDNLFLDEIVDICNEYLPSPSSVQHTPLQISLLGQVAQRIVKEAHLKSDEQRDAPIGRGGKIDDTSVVVSEVVPWTDRHKDMCKEITK